MPIFVVKTAGGKIADIKIVRGAPCGATWDAARRIIGVPVEDAAVRMSLDVQYFCVADPSAWDPISGKSPVHLAADFHKAAMKSALTKC